MKPAEKFALKFFGTFFGVIALIVVICVGVANLNNQSTERAERAIAQEQLAYTEAIKEKHVIIGMTAAQVRQSWGEPLEINRTSTAQIDHEQWIYRSGSYLYFDNAILTSVQQSEHARPK